MVIAASSVLICLKYRCKGFFCEIRRNRRKLRVCAASCPAPGEAQPNVPQCKKWGLAVSESTQRPLEWSLQASSHKSRLLRVEPEGVCWAGGKRRRLLILVPWLHGGEAANSVPLHSSSCSGNASRNLPPSTTLSIPQPKFCANKQPLVCTLCSEATREEGISPTGASDKRSGLRRTNPSHRGVI